MNIRPLQDRVLVEPIMEKKETKRGGIIIPDTAKKKPVEGIVIAVGNGKLSEDGKRIPLELKKGNKVLYGKYAGTEIKLNGNDYLLMREDDVQGIIE